MSALRCLLRRGRAARVRGLAARRRTCEGCFGRCGGQGGKDLSSLCASCDLRPDECSDWGTNPEDCGAYCEKDRLGGERTSKRRTALELGQQYVRDVLEACGIRADVDEVNPLLALAYADGWLAGYQAQEREEKASG